MEQLRALYRIFGLKIIILAGGILLLLVVLLFSLLLQNNQIPRGKVQNKIISIQPLEIGKPITKAEDIPAGVINQETLPDGSISYQLKSPIDLRPNLVVAKDNVVVFERIIPPQNPKELGYALISDFTQKYGQPARQEEGSKFHGWHMTTFIYPDKGFAFIANTNTNEVYEIQVFKSTTAEEYIKNYGEDIQKGEPAKEP